MITSDLTLSFLCAILYLAVRFLFSNNQREREQNMFFISLVKVYYRDYNLLTFLSLMSMVAIIVLTGYSLLYLATINIIRHAIYTTFPT